MATIETFLSTKIYGVTVFDDFNELLEILFNHYHSFYLALKTAPLKEVFKLDLKKKRLQT